MNRLWYTMGVVLLAAVVPCVSAAAYTWVGIGADDDWDTCRNWTVVGIGGCWPNDSGDDASIPYNANTWTINLVSVDSIDDLVIQGSVDFGTASGTPTLLADSITIAGGTYGVTLTMASAKIQVGDPD